MMEFFVTLNYQFKSVLYLVKIKQNPKKVSMPKNSDVLEELLKYDRTLLDYVDSIEIIRNLSLSNIVEISETSKE